MPKPVKTTKTSKVEKNPTIYKDKFYSHFLKSLDKGEAIKYCVGGWERPSAWLKLTPFTKIVYVLKSKRYFMIIGDASVHIVVTSPSGGKLIETQKYAHADIEKIIYKKGLIDDALEVRGASFGNITIKELEMGNVNELHAAAKDKGIKVLLAK